MRRTLLTLTLILGTAAPGLAAPGVAQPAAATAPAGLHGRTAAQPRDATKVLNIAWEEQSNEYNCGPTATRMALKAQLPDPPDTDAIGAVEGTTQNGTDSVNNIRDGLNHFLNGTVYSATQVGTTPTQDQRDKFKQDLVHNIDSGHAMVANIWLQAGGQPRPPGYPTYEIFHYITVIGYDASGDQTVIDDPAAGGGDFKDVPHPYTVATGDLVTWMGGKGYAGI